MSAIEQDVLAISKLKLAVSGLAGLARREHGTSPSAWLNESPKLPLAPEIRVLQAVRIDRVLATVPRGQRKSDLRGFRKAQRGLDTALEDLRRAGSVCDGTRILQRSRHKGKDRCRATRGDRRVIFGQERREQAEIILDLRLISLPGRNRLTGDLRQQGGLTDVRSLFESAQKEGRVGLAHKTELVDARPATPGDVIVTTIAGEGTETRSKPAEAGDMVVRKRCAVTGHEQYLVAAADFAGRYDGPLGSESSGGWRPYRPRGADMLFFLVRDQDGSFNFMAPWGESMIAKPGDAVVCDPNDVKDTYRVARDAFLCSYEVLEQPRISQ